MRPDRYNSCADSFSQSTQRTQSLEKTISSIPLPPCPSYEAFFSSFTGSSRSPARAGSVLPTGWFWCHRQRSPNRGTRRLAFTRFRGHLRKQNFFKLRRSLIADMGMHPAGIVVALKVQKEHTTKLGFGQDRFIDIEFPFECAEERFRTGIVPAVVFPAHILTDIPASSKGIPCLLAAILDPSIGMHNEILENSAKMKSVFPCADNQRGLHVILECPANDPATEKIDEVAKIHPAMNCPDIGDIADPHLSRRRDRKLPVQKIFSIRQAMLRVNHQDVFPLRPNAKAIFSHQFGDSVMAEPPMRILELSRHSRTAIGTMLAANYFHICQQPQIRRFPARRFPVEPCVVAASADLEMFGHFLDRILRRQFLHHRIPGFEVLWTKMAMDFLGFLYPSAGLYSPALDGSLIRKSDPLAWHVALSFRVMPRAVRREKALLMPSFKLRWIGKNR